MTTPLFSIITVTYNASKTILATLSSVLEQTYTNYEHIIMDGASKDTTMEIISKLKNSKLKVYSERDNGLYDAMNKAMSVTTGEYLIFLNAGDTFHSADTLQIIADTINNHNYPGIIYGQTQLVNENRQRIGDRHLIAPKELTLQSFSNGMMVCHQAFIALRRIAGMYDLKYRYSADYEWCIRCLQHSRRNIYIDSTLIDYLYEGLTTANRKASLIERFKIMCYYYGTIPTIIRHLSFIPRYFKQKRKEQKSLNNLNDSK